MVCSARAERLGAHVRGWARLVEREPIGTCSPEGKGPGLRLRLGYYFSALHAAVGAGSWAVSGVRARGARVVATIRAGRGVRGVLRSVSSPRFALHVVPATPSDLFRIPAGGPSLQPFMTVARCPLLPRHVPVSRYGVY